MASRWFANYKSAAETQDLAIQADSNQQVIIVPAFTGLGAPYWNADCRGAIYGLTRNSGPAELAKAALECVGFQTRDLLEAMQSDWHDDGEEKPVLRVDGGMTSSNWAMQFLADIMLELIDQKHLKQRLLELHGWLDQPLVIIHHLMSFLDYGRVSRILRQ